MPKLFNRIIQIINNLKGIKKLPRVKEEVSNNKIAKVKPVLQILRRIVAAQMEHHRQVQHHLIAHHPIAHHLIALQATPHLLIQLNKTQQHQLLQVIDFYKM